MIYNFLSHVPADFLESERYKCIMPGYRLTLPNRDIYYPFVFHGDLTQWYKRLLGAADFYNTLPQVATHFENINDLIEMATERQIDIFLFSLIFSKMSGYLRYAARPLRRS